MSQTTNTILMVRPNKFYSNDQTSGSNSFQTGDTTDVTPAVHAEFNAMVATLKERGVTVQVRDGPEDSPDAIFPNNTFSTHVSESGEGTIVFYPMAAANRQAELTPKLMEDLSGHYTTTQNLRGFRDLSMCLEGTGSLVLDRENKIAYALKSPRTDMSLTNIWSRTMGYTPKTFEAFDDEGQPIYHTNVVMSVGKNLAVIASEVISDVEMRNSITASLSDTGHDIIDISREQMNSFCGNVLEVQNSNGDSLLVMSETAYAAFTSKQIEQMERLCDEIVTVSIPVIEQYGGGSSRCMIAEIFTPD